MIVLFLMFEQVNQEYIRGVDSTLSPPLTTCIPLAGGAAASIGDSNTHNLGADGSGTSLVSIKTASEHVYQQAIYLSVGIGGMLLAVRYDNWGSYLY